MAIGIKGEIKLTIRDRRDGTTKVYRQSNAISYYNFIGLNRNNGLFCLISTGGMPNNPLPPRPNKLILEMGSESSDQNTESRVYSLAGHINTNYNPNNNSEQMIGRDRPWGTSSNGSKTVKVYPLKVSVSGATITYTLMQNNAAPWAQFNYDQGYDNGDNMLPVPEVIEQNNPLGRRKVHAIRLTSKAVTSSTDTIDSGLTSDKEDLASVSGNSLPQDLIDAVIHNFSDIGISYSLTLSDNDSTVTYGGFTDAYLNRLARIIGYEDQNAIQSNEGYGSGTYWVPAYSSTITGNIGPTDTTISVANNAGLSTEHVLSIGNELLDVSNVSGTTVTVTRGAHNTTAANHNSGATVAKAPARTNSFGTQIRSAAIFGNLSDVASFHAEQVASGLTNSATTIKVVVPTVAVANSLLAGEKTFWIRSTDNTYEKVYINETSISNHATAAQEISVIRGAECTTPKAISSGTTATLATMTKLGFVTNADGWNSSDAGVNYYGENGNVVGTLPTPWSGDYGSLLVEPIMIEYYTGNSSSPWVDSTVTQDVYTGTTYKQNFFEGREVAGRFPITLGSAFTPNDKVIVNNYLGIRIGT